MKRSKLFLGVTSGLLAVVAFASAKARWTTEQLGYYTTGPNKTCLFYQDKTAQTLANGSQLSFGTPAKLLYTYSTTGIAPTHKGICGNAAYTEQQ
jgi:hypothetical protein